ncbi:V-type immunoglobulin domain-containing suppressor of T-cell activation [Protopterus annectens]|uniref:V-type immunoglobulin domain-containing suppressor of T-cell activation n=1 Tax=Protopterus annectens TaxID=7888 RepID=UPI001CFABA1A|nr:V-type immunoglobulin domain-containing suppressor of T-cell activation [Protopterus annectens]
MDFDSQSNWCSRCRLYRYAAVLGAIILQIDTNLALTITVPHTVYKCPESQAVSMKCITSGHIVDMHEHVNRLWAYTQHRNQNCTDRMHIRNISEREMHSAHAQGHGVILNSERNGNFYLTLKNLTQQDQGGYCCYIVEFKKDEHGKIHLIQKTHGYMDLEVFKASTNPKSSQTCTSYPLTNEDKEATTVAALATVGCIIGILSLPLILILVYKQRQSTINRRRAHELVRMDSDARGIENPVFDAPPTPVPSTESRPRTVLLGRQQSESGRHLLSEPNTPMTPPGPGDCFFPTLEPIPDTSELVKV